MWYLAGIVHVDFKHLTVDLEIWERERGPTLSTWFGLCLAESLAVFKWNSNDTGVLLPMTSVQGAQTQ